MTTYNTGNAIGSTDARDLYDNAQNFDSAINEDNLTWVDRFGVTRPTFQGVIDDAATRAEFAAGDGASKVGYTPAGTGAVATTMQSKLRESVSVKDFGAVGDYNFSTSTGGNDRDAFVKFFEYCKVNKRKGFIPKGNYYIGTSLPTIGETTYSSTLLGNFTVEGEDMHNTALVFNITDNADVAMQLAENSSGWDMKNFGIRNLTAKKGVGFYINGSYDSKFENIQVFGFDINWKKRSFVTTFINIEGANGNCGFYDLGGTSTLVISSWMNYNTPLAGDSRDFAGCGWFVAASDYNKYVSCAADSNTVAYKVKTTQAT